MWDAAPTFSWEGPSQGSGHGLWLVFSGLPQVHSVPRGSVLRDGHQRLTHPPHYSTSHPTSCRTSPLTPFFPPPETGEPVGEALGGPALGSSSVELRDLWNQLSVDRDASRLLPTSVNCTTVQVHTWVHLLGLSQE